jgi:ABC-type transport system involved in cytochrome bd biosynthesis fused ATPase/permease subunit
MTIMRFKGDPKRIAIPLLGAAVVGAATGLGVAHMSWPKAIGVAVVVGLAAGGLLYALLSAWIRRRPK